MNREVMQLALDALESLMQERRYSERTDKTTRVCCGVEAESGRDWMEHIPTCEANIAANALRAELAKPGTVHEPVAWMLEPIKGVAHKNMVRELSFYEPAAKADWVKVPLYRKENV